MRFSLTAGFVLAALSTAVSAAPYQCYRYKNVRIGGGGGFVPNIIFNTGKKGLVYARTDIGGAYKMKTDGSHEWEPLQDSVNGDNWGDWYVDSLATDPAEVSRVYLFTGAYTNGWDPNPAHILRSVDYGRTWQRTALPFKGGGNMPGRGMGEKLAIDPNSGSTLFVGARSGNGLWKSTNYGATWSKVTSFPNPGTWKPDPNDVGGLNGDIIGISWVTFDPSSSTKGTPSKRIFVGVAEPNGPSVFVTEDAGKTWAAVPGQPTGKIIHKGIISPKENVMYFTYTDGAGPYDGGSGYVQKYNLTSKSWEDISPVKGDSNGFGYGGITIDAQKPGTLMVATLNQWWPDANLWRSTDSGKTWSGVWEWAPWPQKHFFEYDVSSAPWLYDPNSGEEFRKLVGWMIEGLNIDPFDSNHFLYGTGATIFGSRDATNWDNPDRTNRNITIESLATGIEETAILGLLAPPSGPQLISAVGDITGFVHHDLNKAPIMHFKNPTYPTTRDLDYAGNVPNKIIRVGTDGTGAQPQIGVSDNYGEAWVPHTGSPSGIHSGQLALSANGTHILWRTGSGSILRSDTVSAPFASVSTLPSDSRIASDKRDNTIFYGAQGQSFYISKDTGATFTKTASFTTSTSINAHNMAVHPSKSGDIWVTAGNTGGIFHTTDSGKTFTSFPTVTKAYNLALGKAAPGTSYPAVYVVGTVDGVSGVYRSDDQGKTWVKINDAATHGFGAPDGLPISADKRIYGRVFLGTNGRGIFYGDKC